MAPRYLIDDSEFQTPLYPRKKPTQPSVSKEEDVPLPFESPKTDGSTDPPAVKSTPVHTVDTIR
jgi:hypothetical protein